MAAIAEEAGVARTTVSFVLSGQSRKHGISEKTTNRILEIAKRLRFVPNETARSLTRRRTGMIGVLLPGFNSSWAESIMLGLRERLFREHQYVPLIASQHDEPDWEEREIRTLLERQVEAIICCPTVKEVNYRHILNHGVPLVFVGHRAPDLPECSFVAWDGAAVAYEATKILIAKGRKRFAYLGRSKDSTTTEERYRGFCKALQEHDLLIAPKWKLSIPDYTDGREAVRGLFNGRVMPDAILSDLWIQALSALDALDQLKKQVPREVALLALGDSFFCRHGRIQLSAVVEPAEEIGRQAAEIVLAMIEDPNAGPIHRSVANYTFAERGTT